MQFPAPRVSLSAAPAAEAAKLSVDPWLLGAITVIVGLVLVLRRRKQHLDNDQFRHVLAESVLISAIWGTVVIAGLSILVPTASATLTIVLPVFGTWAGTLLAYYFGKENYESAARNSAQIAKALTGIEKLRSISVLQPGIMIPAASIEVPALVKGKAQADYATINLKALRAQLKKPRLPLLDPTTGAVIAVIHTSLVTDYLVKEQARMDTVTLADLLADAAAGHTAKSSFVVLTTTATLADVKEQMTRQTRATNVTCEDAFVTAVGSSRVEGWITNDILVEQSQV